MGGAERQELGEHLRGMREVRVHLHDEVGRERERSPEALLVGRADAEAGTVVDEVHARVGGGERLDRSRRAIGRVVVDDQDVAVGRRTHGGDELRDVLPLVVGRDDDDRARHGRAP